MWLNNLFSKTRVNTSDEQTASKRAHGLAERSRSPNVDQGVSGANDSSKTCSDPLRDVAGKPVFDGRHANQEDKKALGDLTVKKRPLRVSPKTDSVGNPSDTTRSHGSKRFAGLFTFLRSRKHARGPILDQQQFQSQRIENSPPEVKLPRIPTLSVPMPLQNLQETQDSMEEARKVSDQTTQSLDSGLTNVTVYRHPSKQASTPVVIPEMESGVQDPFDETREDVERLPSSDPFSDPVSMATCHERRTSSDYEANRELTTSSDVAGNPESLPVERPSAEQSSYSVWTDSSWSSVDQNIMRAAFNELATQIHIKPLETIADSGTGDTTEHLPDHTALDLANRPNKGKLSKQRSKIFGGIRTIRSHLQLRTSSKVSHGRALRRIKTFAHLPTRSNEMNSLQGKSLEALARLGGHSFLTLPLDVTPATLRLPSCFVATITYLRDFAPSARDLFVEPGDLTSAARIYAHFAKQVLSAEKEQDKIEMTLGGNQIPSDLVESLNKKAPGQNASQVLCVAWVLKALLSGLPGGILGSKQLYQVLVNIANCVDSGSSSNGTTGWRGEFEESLYQNSLKDKATALALLALSSGLQLNLICAIFGLCADLLSNFPEPFQPRYDDLARSTGPGPFEQTKLLGPEFLGEALGPLLTDGKSDEDQTFFQVVEREIQSQRVVEMLVRDWCGISRQLRIWGNRGSIMRAWGSRAERRSDS